MPRRESRLWPAPASPARPRAWRDGAARSFRGLPRADGGDQGRIFSGRIVAEEVERAAMIFASFGAASGDMPPRIFVDGEYLVGLAALKLKGVGAADFAQCDTAPLLAVVLSVLQCGFTIMSHVTASLFLSVVGT